MVVGHHKRRNLLKGHSVKKVENHWFPGVHVCDLSVIYLCLISDGDVVSKDIDSLQNN